MPAGPYSFQLIDPTASIDTGTLRSVSVSQINDAGTVLGTLTGGTGSQPFLDTDGSYTLLAPPGATSTTATQLSNGGEVIGRYTDGTGTHAFLYDGNGNYSDIAVPGAGFTTALQITAGGQILVDYFDSDGLHPAIDKDGTFTTLAVPGASSTVVRAVSAIPPGGSLPVVNDAGEAIGSYTDGTGSHAFLYDGNGGYTTLAVPGGFNTTAIAINASGEVLGTYSTVANSTATANQRSFTYSNGTYATVAVPGAVGTAAAQINDAGQVAGTYTDGTGTHLFLDTDGTYATLTSPYAALNASTLATGLIQLTAAGDVLATGPGPSNSASAPFVYSSSDNTETDASVPGATFTTVQRINDLGQVIGTFSDGITPHAFIATPVDGGGGAVAAAGGAAVADGGSAAAAAGPLLPVDSGAALPTLGTVDPGVLPA